jgi:hypothetical protein
LLSVPWRFIEAAFSVESLFKVDDLCLKREKAEDIQVVKTVKYGNVLLFAH